MFDNTFTDWERVIVAIQENNIAGYCTVAKTDCIPNVPYTPYGVTVCLTHEFSRTRKYASRKKGLDAGTEEPFAKRVYLHVYINDVARARKNRAMDDELSKLRHEYEGGQREFRPAAQRMIDKFLIVKKRRNGSVEITFDTKAIREAKNTTVYSSLWPIKKGTHPRHSENSASGNGLRIFLRNTNSA